jgi:hypothetical protein
MAFYAIFGALAQEDRERRGLKQPTSLLVEHFLDGGLHASLGCGVLEPLPHEFVGVWNDQ